MGAVFAIFSGFYYWFGKITGSQYPELLGQIHFWSTFIGVNLTFMPMHFLGLAGMPRRIPDYPDAYSDWNLVASYGSYVALLSTLFFFYIVFVSLTTSTPCLNNPWDFNKITTKNSASLEWIVTSPPAYHTFEEMPLICETISKENNE
jgi:heme/copper-type cytochrome/quinol oxidase subunit 1